MLQFYARAVCSVDTSPRSLICQLLAQPPCITSIFKQEAAPAADLLSALRLDGCAWMVVHCLTTLAQKNIPRLWSVLTTEDSLRRQLSNLAKFKGGPAAHEICQCSLEGRFSRLRHPTPKNAIRRQGYQQGVQVMLSCWRLVVLDAIVLAFLPSKHLSVYQYPLMCNLTG